jgi:hypothetical protein
MQLSDVDYFEIDINRDGYIKSSYVDEIYEK